MSKSLLIAGIVLSVIAILCGIAALGTTNWMKACLSFKDAMSKVAPQQAGNSQLQAGIGMLQNSDLCFSTGLFRLSFYVTGVGMGFSSNLAPNAWDMFIEATAGLAITGVLILIIGVVFLSLSVCSRSMSAHKKVSASAYGRIGVGILIAATTLYGIGIIVYTIEQSKAVHNPHIFMMQIGNTMQKLFQRMQMGGGSNGMESMFGGNTGRKRRQIDSNSMPRNDSQMPDWASQFPDSGLPDQSTNDLIPVYDSVEPDISNGNYGQPDMQQIYQSLFMNMDPVFDYSFYIAWVCFVLALMATILSALTCFQRTSPYAGDLQPVL